MRKIHSQPLALVVGITLALTACNKQASPPASAAGKGNAATPAASTATHEPVFDVADLGAVDQACKGYGRDTSKNRT